MVSYKNSTTRLNGAFFRELRDEGFKRNGAVSLQGCLQMPDNQDEYDVSVETVIQVDGDIILKIDQKLFHHKYGLTYMHSHSEVLQQFMLDFNRFLEFNRARLVKVLVASGSIASGLITLGYYLFG